MGELKRIEGKDPYGHDLYKDSDGKVVGVGLFGEIYDPMDNGAPMSGSVFSGSGGGTVGAGDYGCLFDIGFTLCIVAAISIFFFWSSFVMFLGVMVGLAAFGLVVVVFYKVFSIYLKTVWKYRPGFHIKKYGLDPEGTRFLIWDHHAILSFVEQALNRMPLLALTKPLNVLALTVISITSISCSLVLATLLSLLRLLMRRRAEPENDPTGRDTNYLKIIRANNGFKQILADQCHAFTLSLLIFFSALCMKLECYPVYLMLALIVAICAYFGRRRNPDRGVTIQLSGMLFLVPPFITLLADTPFWPFCIILPVLGAILYIRSRLPNLQSKLALIVIYGGLLAFSGGMSWVFAIY